MNNINAQKEKVELPYMFQEKHELEDVMLVAEATENVKIKSKHGVIP